jgi:hypothetical protein
MDEEVFIKFEDLPPCALDEDGYKVCQFAAVKFEPTIERFTELVQEHGP